MELIRLRSENMYSFPILDLDFRDYETGTTIILGKNLDMDSANGAGKTTILKILYYALWGKELENVSFSEVTFMKNKSRGFAVELLFKDGENLYKIIRSYGCKLDTKLIKMHDGSSPKNAQIEFLMNGEPFEVEADNKLLKKVIEDKLGISPKIFLNSVLTAQKRKKNFLDSPDSDKKEDLSEILDLGFYDKARKLVDDDLTFQKERLESNKNKLSLANRSIDELKNSIETLLESSKNYKEERRNKLNLLSDEKKQLEQKIINLKKLVSNNKNDNSEDLNNKEKELVKSISDIENKLKLLEKDLEKESKLIEMRSKEENIIHQSNTNIESLNKRNDELKRKLKTYNTNIENLAKNLVSVSEDDLSSLSNDIKILKESILKMKSSREEFNKKTVTYEQDKNTLNNLNETSKEISLIIKKLEEENECLTCERKFGENENSAQEKIINKQKLELSEVNKNKESIKKDLEKMNSDLLELSSIFKGLDDSEKTLSKKEKELSDLNLKKEKGKSTQEKIDFFKKELESIKNELDTNNSSIEKSKLSQKNAKEALDKILPYFKKLENIKNEYSKLKESLKKNQEEYNNIISQKGDLKINIERLELQTKELENKNKSIQELREQKDPYRKMIQENQEKIKNYNIEKDNIEKLIKENEKEITYLTFWLKGFSKTGIKSFETEEVINYLNEKVQDHLEVLSEGMQSLIFEPEKTTKTTGSVSNSINTRFFLNGEERPKESLSGGERQRLVLATDLALSDVAENKSNSSFNIKFLDEPFDGIDSSGQIKALALFNNMSEERKGFFIISHDKEMQSFCDNAIYILKENGISRIVDRNTFLNAGND